MRTSRWLWIAGFLLISGVVFFQAVPPQQKEVDYSKAPDKIFITDLIRADSFEALDSYFDGLFLAYENQTIPEVWLKQAYHAFYNSDPALLDHLNRWVKEFPQSYHAVMSRGVYFLNLGKLHRGGKWMKDTAVSQRKGMKHFYNLTLKDMARARALKPGAFLPYNYMIDVSTGLGNRLQFWSAANEGLKRNPASFILRAEILFGLQPKWGGSMMELDAFISDTAKQVLKNPSLKKLLGYKYEVLADQARKKSREKAHKLLNRAFESGDGSASLYWARGGNAYYMGRYEAAIEDFDKALEIYPQYFVALSDKARALLRLKRFQEAEETFIEALKFDKLDPKANYGLAETYKAQKLYDKSVLYYEAATANYGGHEAYMFAKYGYVLTWYLKDYEQAQKIIRRALELDSERTASWYDYGTTLNVLLDCDVIGVLKRYLHQCNTDSDCPKQNLDWSKDNIAGLVRKGLCPEQAMANW